VKLALATLWILVGGAITGGLYWAFLITPVSTILALITSALLAIAVLAVLGTVVNGAIDILARGFSLAGLRRAFASSTAVIPAGLVVLALWAVTNKAEVSVAQYGGQINAWFIARFGWDDVSWFFTAIRYLAVWLRWVIGGLLAVSLMTAVLTGGWRALASASWVGRAIRPRAVAVATLAFVTLIELPWIYLVPWRPESLPATAVEMVFIVAKLSLAAILAAVGSALLISEASSLAPSAAHVPPSGASEPQTNASLQP